LNGDGGRSQQRSDPGFDRLFTANSQVFASIFEEQSNTSTGKNRVKEVSRTLGRTVSSVIKTYETNALVISGQQPLNGTAFSFNL